MKKVSYKIVPPLMLLALLVYFTIEVLAKSGGITGQNSTTSGGCYCHSTTPSSSTSLSLTSGSLTVEPGSENSYTIRVSNANSSQTKAGINIAVKTSATGETNTGSLSPASGSGLQSMSSELTHSSPKNLSSGNADFSFTWTAPTTPGKYYLRAAGNAVNGNGSNSGDEWNFMAVQEVMVKGVTLTEPAGSSLSYCVGNQVTIKWTQVGVTNLKIELSTNGGSSWTETIESSISAESGTYNWSIPANFQQGNQFKIRISDASNGNINSVMTNNFTISGPFTIVTHPESKELCVGENLSLKVSVNGKGLSFQWKKNGTSISGANDSTYTVSNVTAANAGSYTVVVSSSCQADATSNSATVNVMQATVITSQPVSSNTCLGQSAAFSITADGQNLSYQWFLDNQMIPGATGAQHVISAAALTDAGAYYCEVSSLCGKIKSAVVQLRINNQPVITTQPANAAVCETQTATFTMAATGLENNYDWYLNEVKLTVPSSNSLVIENVNSSNAGNYHCIVYNTCGEPQRTETVILTVNSKPSITVQPLNKSVTVGDMVEFNVTALNGTLSYQWRKDGVNIIGAIAAKYTIAQSAKTDAGDYDCVVKNSCGETTTAKAKLIVDDPIAGPGIRFTSQTVNLSQVFANNSLDTTISNFVINNGSALLKIDSIKIAGTDAGSFAADLNLYELNAGESADLSIIFTPTSPGAKTAEIQFYTNTTEGMHSLALSAVGADWNTVLSTSQMDFGDVEIGSDEFMEIIIMNQSNYDITLLNTDTDCANNDEFQIVSPALPALIAANSNQDLRITFKPLTENSFDCNLNLNFYGTGNTLSVNLKGAGVTVSVDDNDFVSEFKTFPNPSGDMLSFEFSLTSASDYTLDIINLEGSVVKSFNGYAASIGSISWNFTNESGTKLPAGSYLAVLRTGSITKTLNIVLIK